jgi:hypothetical protein
MVIGVVVLYVLTGRTAAATPNGGGESRMTTTPNGGGESRMTATPNGGGDPGRRRMEAAAIPVGGERRRGGFLGRRRRARRARGEAEGELWRSRPSAEALNGGGEGGEADWPHGGQAVAAIPNGGGDPERRRRRSRSAEVGTERRPRYGGRWLRRGCRGMWGGGRGEAAARAADAGGEGRRMCVGVKTEHRENDRPRGSGWRSEGRADARDTLRGRTK